MMEAQGDLRAFSVLVKPASSLCNMRCGYCFYDDVSNMRETKSFGIMREEMARRLIENVFAHAKPPCAVTFAFQGGEPTLAGLAFYEGFCGLVDALRDKGHSVAYAIQTNGLLIDEDWCRFFQKRNFLVGLSLDGNAAIHNAHRADARGKGTFNRVMRTCALLGKWRVPFNLLSVVTRQMARHAEAVLRFYARQGVEYVQFIPCLPPLEGADSAPYALTARLYGDFLCDLFAAWHTLRRSGSPIRVQLFDNLMLLLLGARPNLCGINGQCSPQFVVESNGDVFPCDFYVLDRYRCGCVHENSLDEIENSAAMQKFLSESAAPQHCASCPYLRLCGGGCRRLRSIYGMERDFCPIRHFLSRCGEQLYQIAVLESQGL